MDSWLARSLLFAGPIQTAPFSHQERRFFYVLMGKGIVNRAIA
ncbi:hypothetical protein DDI_3903 [Dickeya dianthicola RNS04.9]|nr:hypothetical protein DDI_3903 [Dickeya dianthicola RNS04.9]